MGAIYSTNITPDPDTGIGNYSLEDFDRAVRSGVAKDRHRLYPAMPYPSYAKISDDDLKALYTFFMKEVPPVKQADKPNEIPLYLSARWPLALWNAIFAPKSGYAARQEHDAAWNRGAYLVQGLGHCGACHTPRGWAFQEKALDDSSAAYLQGAELDAWFAPNLRGDVRTGLGDWSQDDIAAFLKTGHNDKGVVFGSMLDVINNSTPYLTDDDLKAMAVFLKSLPATAQQATFAYDDTATKALQSGKPQPARRRDLPWFVRVMPWYRRQGSGSLHAAACRQCRRARRRSIIARQSRPERGRPDCREGRAGRLSHAAIPGPVERRRDCRGAELRARRLGKRRGGGND